MSLPDSSAGASPYHSTGYVYLALVRQRAAHFIARCSSGSFLAAQELFRRDRANQSQGVWRFAPADRPAECRRWGCL
jgi:hypothetical protein